MDIFPHHICPCHSMFSTLFTRGRPYTLLQEQFSNLKWCRSHHKVCSVLETIKAFGWICFGFFFILFFVAAIKWLLSRDTGSRANRGTPAYPDTRQTQNASATVHPQTVQGAQAHGTAPGVQTKQNPQHPAVTVPTTTNDPIV